MADMVAALRARLVGDSAVAAIVADYAGTRAIFVEDRPQDSGLPSVTLFVISDPRPQHLKGFDGARETRVQADCRAATAVTARALALAVIAAATLPGESLGVAFGRAGVEGPRPLNENVNGTVVYRQSVDLLVWHKGD